AGLSLKAAGDKLIVRGPKSAEPVVRLLAKHKAKILAALTEGSTLDWLARHRESLDFWGSLYPAGEASSLAWGEMQIEWHRRHGKPIPAATCAGCDKSIGSATALALPD